MYEFCFQTGRSVSWDQENEQEALTDYFKVSAFGEMNEKQLQIPGGRWIKEMLTGNSIMVTVCRTTR
jgi:hypothetical protein